MRSIKTGEIIPMIVLALILIAAKASIADNSYRNNRSIHSSKKKYEPIIPRIALIIFQGEKKILTKDKIIHGNIIIESNGKLIIRANLQLDQDSKIIVKQNAQLILDGGQLTSIEGKSWQGVEVWGTRKKSQYIINGKCSQGILVMKNGAIIENATTAVRLWQPGNYMSSGGILFASNSEFINNVKAVEFMSYHNFLPTPFQCTGNLSSIMNCQFITDDRIPKPGSFRSFITLWDTEGICIAGSSFINRTSSCELEERGYGIFTEDANFEEVQSLFQGLTTGICAQSDSISRPICVCHSIFRNNTYGIKLNGVDSSVISSNEFRIGNNPQCVGCPGVGIELSGCNITFIEDNAFTHPDPSAFHDFSIGIRYVTPYTCSSDLEYIHNNIFNQLNIGIQTEETNSHNQKYLIQYIPAQKSTWVQFNKVSNPRQPMLASPSVLRYSKTSVPQDFPESHIPYPSFVCSVISDQADPGYSDSNTINQPAYRYLSEIKIKKYPTREELIEKEWQRKLKDLRESLKEDQRNIFQCKWWEIKHLKTIAEYSCGPAGVKARNILSFCYGIEYLDCPQLIVPYPVH